LKQLYSTNLLVDKDIAIALNRENNLKFPKTSLYLLKLLIDRNYQYINGTMELLVEKSLYDWIEFCVSNTNMSSTNIATVYIAAAKYGKIEVLEFLDPKVSQEDLKIAYITAAKYGKIEVLEFLDPKVSQEIREKAYQKAFEKKQEEAQNFLIKANSLTTTSDRAILNNINK
jgi:hypothetical protein